MHLVNILRINQFIVKGFRALSGQEKHLHSKIITFVEVVFSVTSDWIINLHSCLCRLGLQQTVLLCTLQVSQPLIKNGLTLLQNSFIFPFKSTSDQALWPTFGTVAHSTTYLHVANTMKKSCQHLVKLITCITCLLQAHSIHVTLRQFISNILS